MSDTRIDFGIGEDADYIVLADAGKQKALKAVPDMIAAGLDNEAFLLPLPEDGGISGRVVVGELTDEESNNWVAKAQRQLYVRESKVVVDAGDFFGRETPNQAGNHFILELEPRQYQLTCLIYITENIATDLFRRHKFSYFELFRKTHADRKVPAWLIEEAQCRDNEIDEEYCETISTDEIDNECDDVFVGVLFHFQRDTVVENPTSVSKTGKLKWEKRPPKKFPQPLRLLGAASNATRAKSKKTIASKFATAFANGDFASVAEDCSQHLEPEIEAFLAKMHREVTDKMEIPKRRYLDGESYDRGEWIARSKLPGSLADVASLQKHAFGGSFALRLEEQRKRHEVFRVEISFAFVKTGQGLRVAGIRIRWDVPKQQKRRRPLVANGPPCPECGEALASELAKQCIHCGANWH